MAQTGPQSGVVNFQSGGSLPSTCSPIPIAIFYVVSGGTYTPYYCLSTNTWTQFGGGGGIGGTVSSTHLTMGTSVNTVGDSPATYANNLFTLPEPFTVQAHSAMGVGSSVNGYNGVPSILLLQETQTDGDATALIAALTYNPSVTSAGGQAVYSELDFSLDGTTSADNLSAVDGEAYNHSNTVTTTEFRGGYFYSDSPGSGSVTNQSGLVAQVDKTGSGNDAQLADAWLQSPSFGLGTGTVTQFDGLRIDQISGATHNYQIYSAGTATSYFHGGMQFDNLPTTAQTSVVGIDSSGNLYKQSLPVSNAVSSATGGSGTGTVACVTTCTNLRGSYTVAGGTFSTGTLLTLVWPTTTTAYVCQGFVLNNATGASIGYHSSATATGITFSALTAATGLNLDIDYSCQP